jgi:hypothetical protein
MPTLQEVRRAIYWGERFINKLYQEFTWNGKTYGVIKSHPSAPLSVKLSSKPSVGAGYADDTNRDWLTAGNGIMLPWTPCVHGPDFLPDASVEVLSDTGEEWNGKIAFKYWKHDIHYPAVHEDIDVCTIRVHYAPSPSDPKRMRLEVTPESWNLSGITGDLHTGVSPALAGTYGTYFPRIITDIGAHLAQTVTLETAQFDAFPTNCCSIRRDCQYFAMYYWFDSPVMRERAKKIKALLDYIGQNPAYYQTGVDYRLTDALATDVPAAEYPEAFAECPVWNNLPRGIGLAYYWSRCGFCEPLTEVQWKYSYPEFHPLHWLNKYKDPYKKITYYFCLKNPTSSCYVSPYEMTIGKACLPKLWDTLVEGLPPQYPYNIMQNFTPEQGFGAPGGCKSSLWLALETLSALGYGFGVEEAKLLADQVADVYIKAQWGYPFTSGEEGYGHSVKYGEVNRPDCTGGFMGGWYPAGGYFADSYGHIPKEEFNIRDIVSTLANAHSFGSSDIPLYIPCSTESMMMLAALRVYEFYKWRLPK